MPLTKTTPVETFIKDFMESDDPKFANDSAEQRRKRAIGAWYSMHKESIEKVKDRKTGEEYDPGKITESTFAQDQEKKYPHLKKHFARIGHRPDWELRKMKTALSMMPVINTPEENERLKSVNAILRRDRVLKEADDTIHEDFHVYIPKKIAARGEQYRATDWDKWEHKKSFKKYEDAAAYADGFAHQAKIHRRKNNSGYNNVVAHYLPIGEGVLSFKNYILRESSSKIEQEFITNELGAKNITAHSFSPTHYGHAVEVSRQKDTKESDEERNAADKTLLADATAHLHHLGFTDHYAVHAKQKAGTWGD